MGVVGKAGVNFEPNQKKNETILEHSFKNYVESDKAGSLL